jgi:histidyl-tRNA synthetase
LALKIQERYFAYPPEIRKYSRPLLVRMLQQLNFEEVELLLPEEGLEQPSTDQLQAAGMPQDAAAQGAAPTTGTVSSAVRGMGPSNTNNENQYT